MQVINKNDQLTVSAILTDDNASVSMIPTATDDMYLHIDKLILCVYGAADGAGILRILDDDGAEIWIMNIDGVKDIVLPFGDKGITVGQTQGAQAMLSGANVQASISLALVYHLAAD